MKWEDSYLVKLAVHATATVGMLAERQRCGWLGWGGFAGSTGESQFGAMTKLLLQYQILQERDHAIVDTDDDAMMEDDWYAANYGLRSPRHPDDKDDGTLTFADPQGDVSGGMLGESAKLLAKAKKQELLTGFF
jgi:hypothetical protein